MVAWSASEALRGEAEARLTGFTELVATAIANTEARREVERLVEEQAALRRVATLVARGVSPAEVFEAVASEVGRLLGVGATHMARYEPDGTAIGVGSWGAVMVVTCRPGHGPLSTAPASRVWSSAVAAPREWTATAAPPARSPPGFMRWVSDHRSGRRSSSTGGSGG
jgi:GAF domain-containing protein